jgi:hypothetical protein
VVVWKRYVLCALTSSFRNLKILRILLAQAELRRDQPGRALQALLAAVPVVAAGITTCTTPTLVGGGSHHHPNEHPTSTSSSSSSLPDGLLLLQWGIEQLLKKHQPFLALDLIEASLSAGCCHPALTLTLLRHCMATGSDHTIECLLGLLLSMPSHPVTQAALNDLMSLVLEQSERQLGLGGGQQQQQLPLRKSSRVPGSVPGSKGGSGVGTWMCQVLGLAAARIGHVPGDGDCLRLLRCLAASGALDLDLESKTSLMTRFLQGRV